MRKGFSLVELSVVLVIVGLLIGGVMVGRSIIDSTRRTGVVADWQKYSVAANGYFTKYGYWPGDDAEAANKWTAAQNGNGDGSLGNPATSTDEYYNFWEDLVLAGLTTGDYTGVNGNSAVPQASLTNGFMTHHYINDSIQSFLLAGAKAPSTGTNIISGKGAAAIDYKIDDGLPATGTVGNLGAACIDTTPTPNKYKTNVTDLCNLFYIYKGSR